MYVYVCAYIALNRVTSHHRTTSHHSTAHIASHYITYADVEIPVLKLASLIKISTACCSGCAAITGEGS